MAQKIVHELVDDLDGGEAEVTREFSLDGAQYAIDLSLDNSARLDDALAEYVANARRVGGRRRRSASVSAPVAQSAPSAAQRKTNRAENAEIRLWAQLHNISLAPRGRIPASVIEQFEVDKAARVAQASKRGSK